METGERRRCAPRDRGRGALVGLWSRSKLLMTAEPSTREPVEPVYPRVREDVSLKRPAGGAVGPSLVGVPRAVIWEPHPAVRAVLEHLLLREGYVVEVCGDDREAAPGPALLLAGAEDGSGLHVFRTRDAAGALPRLSGGVGLPGVPGLEAFGIHVFLPKPFGSADVLRVVWAVGGFDGRKKGPRGTEGSR